MKIITRFSEDGDSQLYKECFANHEFVDMLCSNETVDIDDYLNDGEFKIRMIISIEGSDNKVEDIGFAQLLDNGGDCFTIIGGLLPKYFNSGFGLYSAVAVISTFFAKYPNHTLLGGVFLHNERSLRMHPLLGFKKIREQNHRGVFQLTSATFNNSFVNRIKEKIDIQIT